MIITINAGHTLTGPGSGAVGIKNESIENREVTKNVIKYLKLLGHTVIECTVDKAESQEEYLKQVVAMANKHKADYFLSIHFNASAGGKGYGTEILTYNGIQLDPANRILSNISKLGFRNRGVKDGKGLYVIKYTKAKAMLVETCFIDNKDDMSKYNADSMAKAIVEGLTNQKIVEPVSPSRSDNKVKYGIVTATTLRVRDGRSTSSKIIGHLRKNDKIKLDTLVGEWWSIYYGSNGGWVHKDYIKLV